MYGKTGAGIGVVSIPALAQTGAVGFGWMLLVGIGLLVAGAAMLRLVPRKES